MLTLIKSSKIYVDIKLLDNFLHFRHDMNYNSEIKYVVCIF